MCQKRTFPRTLSVIELLEVLSTSITTDREVFLEYCHECILYEISSQKKVFALLSSLQCGDPNPHSNKSAEHAMSENDFRERLNHLNHLYKNGILLCALEQGNILNPGCVMIVGSYAVSAGRWSKPLFSADDSRQCKSMEYLALVRLETTKPFARCDSITAAGPAGIYDDGVFDGVAEKARLVIQQLESCSFRGIILLGSHNKTFYAALEETNQSVRTLQHPTRLYHLMTSGSQESFIIGTAYIKCVQLYEVNYQGASLRALMLYNINDLDFRTNKFLVIEKLVSIRFSEIDTGLCLEFNKLPRFLKKLLAKVNILDQESVIQYRMKR
jgi:hypothetical protein